MEYYYCPVDGEEKKVEIGEALDETMAWSIDIGENGNLFLQISGNGIREINPVDGAVVHEYEKGKTTDYMCVTSEYLIVITDGDVHYYDVASGKPAGGGDALTAQLKKTPANLEFGNSPVLLCCFWRRVRKHRILCESDWFIPLCIWRQCN